MSWVYVPAPPGRLKTVGTPDDGPAEWRTLVDWDCLTVPQADPTAAAWVEAICDELVDNVIGQDRIAWMMWWFDAEAWLGHTTHCIRRRLAVTGLAAQGQALGINLDPGSPLADGMLGVVAAASENRLKRQETWETVLIGNVLWWREQLYDAVTTAEGERN